MSDITATGGFGTRIYFLPNVGADAQKAQILEGQGYVTINIVGAHYKADGNLWQKIFGGSDKVSLSTQVTHISGANSTSCTSIEDSRQIPVGSPFYFGSKRFVALKIPTDCDGIEMDVTISAVKSDNLSGALDILNSGELQSTLQLAPPAVSEGIAIAGVVKKLLTNTDPQNCLQSTYAGRLSTASSDDPIRDCCLVQGTIISIYRESDDDTSLDNLDPKQFTINADGLSYSGNAVQNTYVMFQISFDATRAEDPSAPWFTAFNDADSALDQLATAATDADRQKIWASALATFQQAEKLLLSDPTYTIADRSGIAANRYSALLKKYGGGTGHPMVALERLQVEGNLSNSSKSVMNFDLDKLQKVRDDYLTRLSHSNVSTPGKRKI